MTDTSSCALELTRTFAARRADVFAAFVESDAVHAWWAPKGWCTPHVEMDVRVGGRYRFGMRRAEGGDMMFVAGEYLVVDPPKKLVFTYVWEPGGEGRRWEEFGLLGVTTVVTLEFRELGDMTELLLRHEGFPTSESCEQHRAGWSSNWDCLDDYLVHGVRKAGARV